MSEKNQMVTQYRNEINGIPMRKWTAEEQNFFFAILTVLKNQKLEVIKFDKYELAEIAGYDLHEHKRFVKTLNSLGSKVTGLSYYEQTNNSFTYMPLFQLFKLTWSDNTYEMELEVQVNGQFEHILNKWKEGNWTKFMLEEFTSIQSTYSKTLFRFLKQFKTVGRRHFTIDEIRAYLDIPESYNNSDITSRIVEKSVKDLKPFFKKLNYSVDKDKRRGRAIKGYNFYWEPEKTDPWQDDLFKENIPVQEIEPIKVKNASNYRSYLHKNGLYDESIESELLAEVYPLYEKMVDIKNLYEVEKHIIHVKNFASRNINNLLGYLKTSAKQHLKRIEDASKEDEF